MLRWFPLVLAAASLLGVVFIAAAGARPHQLYVESWRGQIDTAAAAPTALR